MLTDLELTEHRAKPITKKQIKCHLPGCPWGQVVKNLEQDLNWLTEMVSV